MKHGSLLTFFFKRVTSGGGGPVNYHARTQIFLGVFTAFGESAGGVEREQALDRLVRDLHGEANDDYTTYDIFNQFKAIYPFIGGTAFAHSLNLVDYTQHDITWYGSPTHNANGVTLNNTSQYGDVNLNCRTHLGLYNKSGGAYVSNVPAGNTWIWGAYEPGPLLFGVRQLADGKITGVGVNAFYETFFGYTTVDNYCSIDISNSATGKIYNAGVHAHTLIPGATDPNAHIILGGITSGFLGGHTSKLFWLANSLTDAQHLFLYNAITAYQTALGRA